MSQNNEKPEPPPLPSPAPAFAAGSRVRVKKGTPDPNFPDIPLGGWCGTVREIDGDSQPPLYLIEWDRYTLRNMHPAHRVRCDRDGFDCETMWLSEPELEPERGESVPIEQPGKLVPRPLDREDPEDRIRAVFGLTSDEPLPARDATALRRYHQYLSTHLSLPFAALVTEETGPFREKVYPVLILRLLPAEEAEEDGLLVVEAARGDERNVLLLDEVEVASDDPVAPVLEDYQYWIANSPEEESDEPSSGELVPRLYEAPSLPRRSLSRLFLTCGLFAAGAGALFGAVLEAMESAPYGIWIGAVVLGVIGFVAGAAYGRLVGILNRSSAAALVGGTLGTLAGAVVGALIGALAIAYVGSILGSIAGTLVGRGLARIGWRPLGEAGWMLLGAWAGALVLAWHQAGEQALLAAGYGAGVGAIVGVVLMLGLLMTLVMMFTLRR